MTAHEERHLDLLIAAVSAASGNYAANSMWGTLLTGEKQTELQKIYDAAVTELKAYVKELAGQ